MLGPPTKIGILYIYKNGAEVAKFRRQAAIDRYISFTITTQLYLDSDDYIEIYYYNGDTSARDIYIGSNQTWFCAFQFATS